jgi:membrane-associated PAP2 superfamily phosphatase
VDIAVSRLWSSAPRQWFGNDSAVCKFLNDYGALPALLPALGVLPVFLLRPLRPDMKPLCRPALYFMLAYLLGPGLLVNGVLKHSWARARPKDIVEFGKKQAYEPVFLHVEGSNGRSFPSGHASAAFFLCSLGFASSLWGSRRGMWAGLVLGVIWGVLVGWSRIASGAHFLTDVLWSAALVNGVNLAVLRLFARWEKRAPAPHAGGTLATVG